MDVIEYGEKSSQVVLIQPVDENDLDVMESEFEIIKKSVKEDFLLRAFKVKNWNVDLSPWNAPAVFGKQAFGAGAERTLAEVVGACSDETKRYFIGGYSLAGLFAVWSACRTGLFDGVAAASPSIWFPGFVDYMKSHGIKSRAVYLSLGDKEAKTRNPVMATVAQRIQEAYACLRDTGIKCSLEWNEGNHFAETDVRTAKAFSWLINNCHSIDFNDSAMFMRASLK
ncbi:MAG: esterase [Lachnospiraceae bacterium]|nr:esterase [Lachnospiraceae bacterium]